MHRPHRQVEGNPDEKEVPQQVVHDLWHTTVAQVHYHHCPQVVAVYRHSSPLPTWSSYDTHEDDGQQLLEENDLIVQPPCPLGSLMRTRQVQPIQGGRVHCTTPKVTRSICPDVVHGLLHAMGLHHSHTIPRLQEGGPPQYV